MPPRRVLLASVCLLASTLAAQTYTPKTIRFDGVPAADAPALLTAAGLTQGKALTKAEIEAALGRLADTGTFSDISYTVDASALVIKLTSDKAHAPRPVRFANFVWWQPDELERLIEARVPLFHGEMPASGSLTDDVKAALVAIAKEKGLTITVDVHNDSLTGKLALTIETPSIVIGKLDAPDVQPLAGASMASFKAAMRGQEFDQVLSAYTIHHDTLEIYQNAGFLDATVAKPTFSAPRAEGPRFLIDAAVTVEPHDLYRVAAVDIHGPAVVAESELRKASGLKPGDPASPMLGKLAGTSITTPLRNLGYLDGAAREQSSTDKAAHTVSYSFDVVPGEVYHLSRISVEGSVDPQIGQALQHNRRLAAGVVAGSDAMTAAMEVLRDRNALNTTQINLVPNHADHTAALVVTPRRQRPGSEQ